MATRLRPHGCSAHASRLRFASARLAVAQSAEAAACAIPVTRGLKPPRYIMAAASTWPRGLKPSRYIAVGVILIVGLLHAQAPAGDAGFEVASVKPNGNGGPFPFGRIGLLPGGRFTAVGATVRELIRAAYGLREDAQIAGGPGWVSADRFDVEAKAPADASIAQAQAMLKSLLADRFKLAVHTESRQLPLYALVTARSNGKTGEGLRRSGAECAPITLPAQLGPAPPPPPPPPAGAPRPLAALTPMRCGSMLFPGLVSAREITIEQFVIRLAAFVNRPVIDRTGLTGNFDLDLSYTPDSPARGAVALPSDGPSIFTALQEQLGLKLDSQRGPVDVFVIDRAERPTPD